MIILKDVSKYYSLSDSKILKALDNVSITFEANKMTAIIGVSGSGKTTLLKIILCLIDANEGTVIINGVEHGALESYEWDNFVNGMCAYVSQDYNLIPNYTCYDNIILSSTNSKKNKLEVRKDIVEICQKLGITDVLYKKTFKLSGGQKQRCAIAQAIIKDTPILIFDEFTSNIDEKYTKIIYKLLLDLSKNKTIIIVSHDLNNIKEYCSSILEIKKGKLIFDKNIDLIQNSSKDVKYDFDFIEKFNFLKILKLSFKNIVLSLKNRLIPFVLVIFSLLFVVLSLSMLSSIIDKNNSYNIFFPNNVNDRLVISKINGNSFTESELDTILNIECNEDGTQCIKNYMYNDFLLDYEFNVQKSFVKINCFFSPLKNLEDEDIIQGRMPENENEFIIYNTSSFNIGDDIIITESSAFFNTIGKVVGKTNSSTSLIYLSEEQISNILYLTELQRISTSNVSYTGVTSSNEVIDVHAEGVSFNPYISREKILISMSFLYEYYLIDEMSEDDFEKYKDDIKNRLQSMESIEISLTDFYGNDVKYTFYDFDVIESISLFEINEDLFYDLFYSKQGYQISVFANSNENFSYLENEIEQLDENYDVLIPSKTSHEYDDFSKIKDFSLMLFVSVLSILSFILIIFTVMFTQKRNRRREFESFFFAGISRKRISIMVLIENLWVFILSILFVYICIMVLNRISQIRVISMNILRLDSIFIIAILIILLYFYFMIDFVTSRIHNSNKYIK